MAAGGHFFTLFAFALNNQQDATVHFFFGTAMAGATGVGGADAFAAGLVTGVLGMVPRWWRHRNIALKAANSGNPPPARPQRRLQQFPCPTTTRLFMEFDATGCCWGCPGLCAGLAGLAFDLRQLREENRRAPKAYFRG